MEIPPIPCDEHQTRKITPTDVTQFIRHAQCERFLRLQLHARNADYDLLYQNGLQPQPIPPLLSQSGSDFEQQIEKMLQENSSDRAQMFDFASVTTGGQRRREPNNGRVIEMARELKNGQTLWLLQPRLETVVGAWNLRGDADMLRLERDETGTLQVMIADMKSTSMPKVEHRLQVGFYHEMLTALLREASIEHAPIELGILYRGPLDDGARLDTEARKKLEADRVAALNLGLVAGFYERITHAAPYLRAVRELVTGENSAAARIASSDYHDLQWHLEAKCDGCIFNQWCLTSAAHDDDLSLLPHLGADTKSALHNNGIRTVTELAALKSLRVKNDAASTCSEKMAVEQSSESWSELVTNAGEAARVQRLSSTRGLGHRLDELVHRALRYCDSRNRGLGLDGVKSWWDLPSKGYGTLPFCGPNHHPNLVKIFIDTQFDYLHERLYGLSALVVAYESGMIKKRRAIVEMTQEPPETDEIEADAVTRWIEGILRGVSELAAPDENGEAKAPIHLIFFNQNEQTMLLESLGRHFERITGATPLFDFVTQIAALDGAMVTFLEAEMRELKNYPRTCSSLHEISGLLEFDWNNPRPFKTLFKRGIFDGWGQVTHTDDGKGWVQNRARFSSHYPLEYAYAAWAKLPQVLAIGEDEFAEFRGVTVGDWHAFQARRLDAMEWVANDFKGNRQTEKTSFALPDLSEWHGKAQTLADALDEFITIERHAELGAWKQQRLAPPERRALAGHALVCKYLQEDQTPETLAKKAHNEQTARDKAAWKEANPDKKRAPNGLFSTDPELTFRLRLHTTGSGISMEEMLTLSSLRAGERVVIAPRWDFDSRLPAAEQTPYTPTPKAMLYDMRADIVEIERAGELCFVDVKIVPSLSGGENPRGFVFRGHSTDFQEGEIYSLDPNPDDWHGLHILRVVEGLIAGEPNALLARVEASQGAQFAWSKKAAQAQQRFLDGLNALAKSDAKFEFEAGKQRFIGKHGDAPYILVQGPPGTGKSYATSWALLARLQGAIADERELRVLVCCKTHAAVDVLLRNLRDCRAELEKISCNQSELFDQYFERALLEIPVFRFAGKAEEDGIESLKQKRDQEKGETRADKAIIEHAICVVGATPGGVFRLCKDASAKTLFGNKWFDALVIDEASQMNLPEAMMGALAMKADFALIVVGDPRQMPPIVKHDWKNETRRTFQDFRVFESLYDAVNTLDENAADWKIVRIAFEQSFRLHRDMAEFLRREIYAQDGINFFSKRTQVLAAHNHEDPFVAAVLNPAHALTVIVHNEANSVLENGAEARLIEPILAALAAEETYALDAQEGLGIVVPHRAQRALLRDERWNVDTVERFQGDERRAMLFCATESERAHLSRAGGFLYDPRRLNVALSRAKQKMILVASETVFNGFFADEETFHNAQLWKNLLADTCNQLLWNGERADCAVWVWGNDLRTCSRDD